MITVTNLSKYYGDFPAVRDISFSVNKGEILGFLGPNGAGKTTVMRILTGFMPPTSGTAVVAGFDVVSQSIEARKRTGYMPETVPLYTDMTVHDYLDFQGAIRGIDKARRNRRILEVIEQLKLQEYEDTLIAKLSKGFRQRTGLAQAILHEPEVLVLDEPTIGIDPIQVVDTRQLIRSLGGQHTIIISSHILPEVSMVCQRVVIINDGHLVAIDTPEKLSATLQAGERVLVEARGPGDDIANAIRKVRGVREVKRQPEGDRQKFVVECAAASGVREQIATTIVRNGWGLLGLQTDTLTLEEIFLRLTVKEEHEASA